MLTIFQRHIHRLLDRSRLEHGIALPTSLMMLFIIGSLTATSVTVAITGNSQSGKDRSTKRAIAAADAGTDTALYRLNKLNPSEIQCVVVTNAQTRRLGKEDTLDGFWCREQSEDLGDGASFKYKVSKAESVTSNGQGILRRTIVSTGIVNGVQRRTLAYAGSLTGRSLLGDYAVISDEDLVLPNTTRIDGNAGTNGNVDFDNPASRICGDVTYGRGKDVLVKGDRTADGSPPPPPNNGCAGQTGHDAYEAAQPFVLTPVVAPPPDSNTRLAFGGLDPRTTITEWNSTTKVLRLNGTDSLTLTGNTYVLCYLEIYNNSQLIVASRSPQQPPLRIYIDSPENCLGAPVGKRGTVSLGNSSTITNANSDPNTLQLYMVGSPTIHTTVSLRNSFLAEIAMIIYAPRSWVEIENAVKINGGVAAKRVVMENSSRITYSALVKNLTLDNLVPLYKRQSWTECMPQPSTSQPTSGC